MDEWRNRLALAPEKVIKNTLEVPTQLALDLELDNRTVPKRHLRADLHSLSILD